ncbi:G-protein coupled receptor 35-like isoform X2 [Hemicordylus capensis]|uniref:G-protein coupled receptor 35-like isoform X2 n=1 Tax=Hemicordylus capensis TaxID=884348 RepID=UPI00230372ED|nr:G-protein coupled receptor 35-like isoform X2 [Hemicordylus capensis]
MNSKFSFYQLHSIMVNCSETLKMDDTIILFEFILYSPVTVFGGLFNTLALWVFFFRLGKWTESRVYMICLAMADYTVVFTLPFIVYFHYRHWITDAFCLVIFTIYCLNMPMSMCTITIIALDRYIAIKHPLKAKVLRSPRKAAIVCVFLWLCCFLSAIRHVFIHSEEEKEKYCFSPASISLHDVLIQNLILFFIPLLMVTFCSTQVIRCLKRKENAGPQEEKSTQKAIHVVSVNMGTFIICFVPFNVTMVARYAVQAAGAECWVFKAIGKAVHISAGIANLNCCLDAVCYYLVAKEFQEAASLLTPFQLMKPRSTLMQDSQLQSRSNLTQDAPLQSTA